MILHVVFYHFIPEYFYDDEISGDYLSFIVEVLPHLSGIFTMILSFIAWNLVFPIFYPSDTVDQN